jgi:serine/threonine-protein kinase RsbW
MTVNLPGPTQPERAPLHAVSAAAESTGPGGPESLVLEQVFSRASLYQLRAAVAAQAADAGLPQPRTQDVVLAVYELVANVIRHGTGQGRLRMWRQDRSLRCQVTDTGTAAGDSPAEAPLQLGRAEPWPIEAGHGLWLVCQLADQASFHACGHGCAATVTFTLRPAGAGLPKPGGRGPHPG